MIDVKRVKKYCKEDLSKIDMTWKLINGKRVYFPKEGK